MAGLLTAVAAMTVDRARGRRRCPRCFYAIQTIVGDQIAPDFRCAECGKQIRSLRQLRRTRRHWRLALVGTVLLIPGCIGVRYSLIRERGWQAAPPDLCLIAALPFVEPFYTDGPISTTWQRLAYECWERRHEYNRLERRIMLWGVLNFGLDDAAAPATDGVGRPLYCELLCWAQEQGMLRDGDRQRINDAVVVTAVMPPGWPNSRGLSVRFEVSDPLQRQFAIELDRNCMICEQGAFVITRDTSNWSWVDDLASHALRNETWHDDYHDFMPSGDGARLQIRMCSGTSLAGSARHEVMAYPERVVEVVPVRSLDLEGRVDSEVRDAAIDEAWRASDLRLLLLGEGYFASFDARELSRVVAQRGDFIVSVEIQLRTSNLTLASGHMWWSASGPVSEPGRRSLLSLSPFSPPLAVYTLPRPPDPLYPIARHVRLLLREGVDLPERPEDQCFWAVKADPAFAQRAHLTARRMWDGEVTLPFRWASEEEHSQYTTLIEIMRREHRVHPAHPQP
jgi:hypothetical protein